MRDYDDRSERRYQKESRDDRPMRGRYENYRDEEEPQRTWPSGALAADLMTTEVITARHDDPIVRAARIMRSEDVGAVPVVDRRGRPVGVITDRDITCRAVASGEDVRRIRVEECMSDEVYSCQVDATLDDCMREMARHQVRRLLVCERDGRLTGIISQADLARHATRRRDTNERRQVTDVISAVSKPNSGMFH